MGQAESSSGEHRSRISSLRRPIQVIIVSSVMFTFISYWRMAAVVLCDLASTAYYIGGIVEGAIGPAAPWFILAVMLFSYAVRSIYIESCSLFVRGGVYRVVKQALGGFLAKLAVSALMFDYILTGPISGMSAGQYIMGLVLDGLGMLFPELAINRETADFVRRGGAMLIAGAITVYFFRQNILGIHESSGKALKIMIATTIMAVVMLGWCGATLALRGPVNKLQFAPDLAPKIEYEVVMAPDRVTGEEREQWRRDPQTGALIPHTETDNEGRPHEVPKLNDATGHQEDPLGFISRWFPGLAERLHRPGHWLSIVGLIGLLIAFGHSVLAMSGEETLAQVYREVESPKLRNFKKAAFIVFLYSLLLTAGISFLAVLLIPDEVRMKDYADNLIGGLAMHVMGPPIIRLLLNAFVVVIGFLILAGAVNTAIIGSNGVLNRVAEDGVLPDWFLKPHRRYGTTSRVLWLIVVLQLITIVVSRGDMYVLGEAYAFGVVWSFVFQALSMVVLRFKDPSPREFKVPLNVRIRGVEIPIGLSIVLLILLATAFANLLTKEVATLGGLSFTAVFLTIFAASEAYHDRKRGRAAHKHIEQFNQQISEGVNAETLGLSKLYRKLVSIRSTQNLFMLEKALRETDSETTDVIVMTAKPVLPGGGLGGPEDFDHYDRELMTAVVTRAETIGKPVKPLILPTNNPLYAIVSTASALQAQELILGASNKFAIADQLEQIAFYWINLHEGETAPLTVRILSSTCDVSYDLGGGNRIPKIGERQARSIAQLRAAGVGVGRALLIHANNAESSDLFDAVLTMLDPDVALILAVGPDGQPLPPDSWAQKDLELSRQLRRVVSLESLGGDDPTSGVVRLAREKAVDLIIVGQWPEDLDGQPPCDVGRLMREAPCRVCLVSARPTPQQAEEA